MSNLFDKIHANKESDYHISKDDNYSISAWDSFKPNKIISIKDKYKSLPISVNKNAINFLKVEAEPLPSTQDINRGFWGAGIIVDAPITFPFQVKTQDVLNFEECIKSILHLNNIITSLDEIKNTYNEENKSISNYISSKAEIKENNQDIEEKLLDKLLKISIKFNVSCFCYFADKNWISKYYLVSRVTNPSAVINIIKLDSQAYYIF